MLRLQARRYLPRRRGERTVARRLRRGVQESGDKPTMQKGDGIAVPFSIPNRLIPAYGAFTDTTALSPPPLGLMI